MAPNSPSTRTGVITTHANDEDTTPSTALPPTLLPYRKDPSPELGQYPSTSIASGQHCQWRYYNIEVAGHGCIKPPTPSLPHCPDSNFGPAHSDSSPPYAHDYLFSSVSHALRLDKSVNLWLVFAPPDAPSLSQRLRDSQHKLGKVQTLMPSRCTTMSTLGSRGLNYHVNPDNDMYRWQTTEVPIPVGIDLSSFESSEERRMIKTCLITVLDKFNASNVGPKFRYVIKPCQSAFFVRFGGDHPLYAHSFFPGSHPKDWYIDVYKLGLTLGEDQEQFLMETSRGDIVTARKEALERNLINILTHEMLHVVGVRHCDAQRTEMEACVRFPPDLSDDENNEELLMQRSLDWRNLCELQWLSRTIQEIQQIYAMNVGERIGCHKIRDVSWQVGAAQRKEIALRNARCCVA